MEFEGRYTLPAPPAQVWAALHDPDVLKTCIPDCEALRGIDDTRFEAVIRLAIAQQGAAFHGTIAYSDQEPPLRLTARTKAEGVTDTAADITLAAQDDGTDLHYHAGFAAEEDPAVRRIAEHSIDKFLSNLAALLGVNTVGSASPPGEVVLDSSAPAIELPPAATAAASPSPMPTKRTGMAPEIWVVGLIAVIVILLVLFGLSL